MKRSFWIAAVSTLLCIQLSAAETFEQRFGGRYNDMGKEVIVLSDGYLIGGNTQSFGHGQNDIYLIRLDRSGKKLRSTTIGGTRDDLLGAMIFWQGGIMISGQTESFGNRQQSLLVGRVAGDGTPEWYRGYYMDEDNRYEGNAMAPIDAEKIVVGGMEDQVKFFNGEIDFHFSAIDIDDKHLWGRSYGGTKEERITSMLRLKEGYLFAGTTRSYGKGREDFYLVRLDEHFDRVWHRTFGFKEDESLSQIITTQDGGMIAVGTTDSFHDLAKEIYVVKMDAKGKLMWQGHYGYREDEEGFGIIEQEHGYVVVGYTKSTKERDKDLYLIGLDQEGGVRWERRYGGADEDIGYAIAKTQEGMIVVGSSKIDTKSGDDLYVLKLDALGKR